MGPVVRDRALGRLLALTSLPLGLTLVVTGITTGQATITASGGGALIIAATAGLQLAIDKPHPSIVVAVGAITVVALAPVQMPAVTFAAGLCLAGIGTPVVLYHHPRRAFVYLALIAASLAVIVVIVAGTGVVLVPALVIVVAAVWGGARLYGETSRRLHDSEARFRTAFQAAPVAVLLTEGDAVRWANGAFERLMGLPPGTAAGMSWTDATGDPETAHLLLRGLKPGEVHTVENQILTRRDGRRIPAHLALSGTPAPGIAAPGAIVHILDMTRQQSAHEVLRTAEERHRSSLSLLPVALWEEDYTLVGDWLASLRASGVTDLRAYLRRHPEQAEVGASLIRVDNVNPAAVRLVGATDASDLIGPLDPATVTTETRESLVEQFVAIWEGRTWMSVDVVGRTRDGRPLDGRLQWVAPTVAGVPDLSRVLVAITDLTERRKTERELERRVELENLIAQLSTHFINVDADKADQGIEEALAAIGRHAGAERSYLFRIDPHRGVLSNTHEWCAPGVTSMKDRIQQAPLAGFPWIARRLEAGMAIVIGDVAELPDDATAERAEFERQGIRSLINVPMVAAGKTVGFIGFDSLSTAQTWADVDVRLLRLVGEMFLNALERKQADERMASLMASKDQLVASVSHELRTPLTVVVGLVEELATRPDLPPGDRTEFVELIRDQSHELTHIVEDLLVASRAGTGELVVVPERLSLAHEIGQVLKLMPDPRGKSIETRGHCRDVDADRLRVRQILRNLLSNAIRYGGDLITITLEDRRGRSALMVADDGPGVPLEDRDRIFELYQRAHETPGLPGSLGIGLAVSRRLARLMGGDLTFVGRDGNAFVLELPLAVEDRPPDPVPDGAGRSSDPPADVTAHAEGPSIAGEETARMAGGCHRESAGTTSDS